MLVTVGAGVYDQRVDAAAVHHPAPAQVWSLAHQIEPHACCPRLHIAVVDAGAGAAVVAGACHDEVQVLVRV